jgi:hypothetical protein
MGDWAAVGRMPVSVTGAGAVMVNSSGLDECVEFYHKVANQ